MGLGDGEQEWTLHARVAAAALRAGCAALPALLFLPLMGPGDGLPAALALGVGLLGLFLLERRDLGWQGALVRTPLAGLAAGLTVPLTGLWVGAAWQRGPESGYQELGRFLSANPADVPALVWCGGLAAAALLPWACARAASAGLGAALGGGAASGAALGAGALLGAAVGSERGDPEMLAILGVTTALLAGVGAVLALAAWAGDRLVARAGLVDPPPPPAQPRGRWALALGLAALAGLVWGAALSGPRFVRGYGNEAAAVGALKSLVTAQELYREADADPQAPRRYAASLAELEQRGLIDAVLAGGVKQGYLFRLARASGPDGESRWCAAADPVTPGRTGVRAFFVNQLGVVHLHPGPGAAPLDLQGCEPPTGFQPLGGG